MKILNHKVFHTFPTSQSGIDFIFIFSGSLFLGPGQQGRLTILLKLELGIVLSTSAHDGSS